jgi:hypothetical protein
MQLAAPVSARFAHRPIELAGKAIARLVDRTDMPGSSLDLVALRPIGPNGGWASLEQARAAALQLTAGDDHPAAAILGRAGRYEAWLLGSTLHGFDPTTATPLYCGWSEDLDVGYARTSAGRSMVEFVGNGTVFTPSTWDSMRDEFRFG